MIDSGVPPVDSGLVVPLNGSAGDARLLGGKAGALDRVVALGRRVPASRVLTADAYRCFVAQPELANRLSALRSRPVPDPEHHDRERDAVDRLFLGAPMPTAVDDAVQRLVPAGGIVAVRSSATAEDMATASFAGQYRTVLRVGHADIDRAVRLVWASLWHPAPRAYRAFRGVDDGDLAMAVLVMDMIESVVAGVLFTRDPTGSADHLRLEEVDGLGDSLVSGSITPRVRLVPRTNPQGADIRPDTIELVRLGLALERDLGAPQDIEWARDADDRVWVLQARPITTAADWLDDGFDVHHPAHAELTTAGIAEMLPGVLQPLVWDATSRQVENGFRELFDALGAPVDDLVDPHALIARVRGRAAIDLDRLRRAAASIPGGSAAELERRYFGEVLAAEAQADQRRLSAWQGIRILRQRHRSTLESDIVNRAIDMLLDAEPDPGAFADWELLAYRRRVHDLAARTAAAEIIVAALAAAAYRGVEAALTRRHGRTAGVIAAQRLTRPRVGDALSRATADVLADLRSRADLDGLEHLDWADASARITATAGGTEMIDRLTAAFRRAGCTAVFGGTSWSEQPDLAWMASRDRLAPRTTRDDVVDVVDGGTDGEADDVDVPRRGFLRREIDDATSLLSRREHTKAALLALGGVARRVDDEIGRRLVDGGLLDDVADVRLLTGSELTAALCRATAPSGATVARRRRILHHTTGIEPLPHRFRGIPVGSDRSPATGDVLHGWGASPGVHEGAVRIVGSPAGHTVRRGDVVVATATDASWAPLFHVAGGLVIEEGGPLSHAAIVARELGVPAVVNIPGIVERLRTAAPNATVTVDGTRGLVRIHEHADVPLPLVPVRNPPQRLTPGLGVFVTGLIGAGALLGAVVSLTEAIDGARARRRLDRRAAAPASALVRITLGGSRHASETRADELRPRWLPMAALIIALSAIGTLAHAAAQYLRSDRADRVLWLAVLSMTAVSLATVAVMLGRSARRWPEMHPALRRAVPVAKARPGRFLSAWNAVPRSYRRGMIASAATFGGLLFLVTTAESWLRRVDSRVYDALGAGRDAHLWGPAWFDRYLGTPSVVVPAALVITLFTLRCRVLALAYPLAIVAGGLLNLGLGALVGRERPFTGEHPGRADSFPSGGAIEAVLLLGLLPLAVGVLTSSPAAMRRVRVVATAVLLVMLVDNLRSGSHWPSDQLAGIGLGVFVIVAVHAAARVRVLHARCTGCPARALADATPARPDEGDRS